MFIKKLFIVFIGITLLYTNKVEGLSKSVIDITKMNLREISEALNQKIITSEELVKLYLERIEAYDKDFNAIISINENAINEAKELDELRSKGKIKSLLHGIPIIVKDNIDVTLLPTTAGAKALKDNYPKANAFVIQRLMDAGVIILAKANMSEFAFEAVSSRSSYGTVKNAYNPEYSAYGSSGGSAVSVALNFAPAALGTDTNSSIRLPAAATNLVGFRPTVGLISRTGVLPYDPERDTIGTLTKTVDDAMLIINIINGYDKNDYKSINQDTKNYIFQKKDLKGITIGIPTDFLIGSDENKLPENKETYSEIKELMQQAIEKLQASQAKIVYLDNYYNYETDYWFLSSLSGYLICDSFNKYIKNTTGTIRSFNDLYLSNEKITYFGDYIDSCDSPPEKLEEKNILKEDYRKYIENIMIENNIDVMMYPTTKNKLLKRGATTKSQNLSAHASSTINYPAITLPLGFDENNLPYGIEFMAKTNEEQLLFDIANIYEKLNGNNLSSPLAPSLYEIPKEAEELVDNYKNIFNKNKKTKQEKSWLIKVQNIFRNYSEEKNFEKINMLNIEYSNIEKTVISKTLPIVYIFIGLFFLQKIIKNTKLKPKRLKKHK